MDVNGRIPAVAKETFGLRTRLLRLLIIGFWLMGIAAMRPAPVAALRGAANRNTAAEVRALNQRNSALEAQVRKLQAELADITARTAAVPTAPSPMPPPTGGAEDLQSEVSRLRGAVEELHRRLDPPAASDAPLPLPPTASDAGPRARSSTALVMGVLGLLVGWLLGIRYGRRHERGRRSRIRF